MNTVAFFFVLLWGLNGWFQSVGSAPSCVSIYQWFSPKQRGSRYSIWGGSRNIGEGITWILTASLVSYFGWRAGFIGAGIAGVVASLIMFKLLKDRPQTYGMPDPGTAFEEGTEIKKADESKRNTPCANVHPEATCGMAYRSGLCGDVHLSLRHVFLGSAVPARAKRLLTD